MRDLEAEFADYADHHTDPLNKVTHFIGIPLIALCLLGLGSKLRLIELGWLPVDVGVLFGLALVGVYFAWRPVLALGVASVFVPLYLAGSQLSTPMLIGLLAFAVGLQYVGHFVFEKRAPAFHRNLIHTLVGPLWIAASFFRGLGRLVGWRA